MQMHLSTQIISMHSYASSNAFVIMHTLTYSKQSKTRQTTPVPQCMH